MRELIRKLFALVRGLARENSRLLLGIALTALLGILLTAVVIAPSWKDPKSKFYGSKLGYPSVMRKLGRALPVEVATARPATFEKWIMGEGTCASIPLLAPVIPMAMVKEVLVKPGDRVTAGQVIARMDTALAEIKLESAKLAVETARAELSLDDILAYFLSFLEHSSLEQLVWLPPKGSILMILCLAVYGDCKYSPRG